MKSIGELLSLAAIHLDVRTDTVEKAPIVRELQWELSVTLMRDDFA